jgi:hypothetical protein
MTTLERLVAAKRATGRDPSGHCDVTRPGSGRDRDYDQRLAEAAISTDIEVWAPT